MGKDVKKEEGCRWNIANNMVGEFEIKQPQIDFYMMHTCYGRL